MTMETVGDNGGLRLDADDLQEVVALCDTDGIILTWNAAGEEITGFSRDEVIGYHMETIVAPGSRDMLDRILSIGRTGTLLPGLPVRLRTSYGMEVPAEVTSTPRREGAVTTGWLLIFRDTTLKVQLQEQLDRLDVLYRGLVENSPDLIYVLDSSAKVLFINDTVETLLGYEKTEIIGRELIEFVHPEDRDHAYWPLRERRRADRATRNIQLRFMTRQGAARRYDLDFVYVSLSSVGLGSPGSRARSGQEGLGTQGIARDVTELRILQEFSRHAGLILPVCSVCRKIRVGTGEHVEWIPLAEYISRTTGTVYSHTFCPEHLPAT